MDPPEYTLPGIINYLQNEFTKIEKYKILADLERSEMKFKISNLEGEINSLNYINDKLVNKLNIANLENYELKKKIIASDSISQNIVLPAPKKITINSMKNLEELDEMAAGGSINELNKQFNNVDLSVLKRSRDTLTKSMKEIIYLLKTPNVDDFDLLNMKGLIDSNIEMETQQPQLPKFESVDQRPKLSEDLLSDEMLDNSLFDNNQYPPPNLEFSEKQSNIYNESDQETIIEGDDEDVEPQSLSQLKSLSIRHEIPIPLGYSLSKVYNDKLVYINETDILISFSNSEIELRLACDYTLVGLEFAFNGLITFDDQGHIRYYDAIPEKTTKMGTLLAKLDSKLNSFQAVSNKLLVSSQTMITVYEFTSNKLLQLNTYNQMFFKLNKFEHFLKMVTINENNILVVTTFQIIQFKDKSYETIFEQKNKIIDVKYNKLSNLILLVSKKSFTIYNIATTSSKVIETEQKPLCVTKQNEILLKRENKLVKLDSNWQFIKEFKTWGGELGYDDDVLWGNHDGMITVYED